MKDTTHSPTLDVIVLTAGESSRLGQPKQHIMVGKQSLLERTTALACDLADALSSPRSPIVISGAYLQQDCMALVARSDRRKLAHHYNPHWREGMPASLECARPVATADGVLVLLVDQYRVRFDHLQSMHDLWLKQPRRAVAARYAHTLGPPVIWPQHLWAPQDLIEDRSWQLGKSVLESSSPQLIDIPDAAIDVDTPDDLIRAMATTQASQ